MPIENNDGCIVITSENSINYARMVTLKAGLRLETKGLSRRGRSCYSIIKEEFGLKGSKQRVLEQFEKLIDAEYPNARSAQ